MPASVPAGDGATEGATAADGDTEADGTTDGATAAPAGAVDADADGATMPDAAALDGVLPAGLWLAAPPPLGSQATTARLIAMMASDRARDRIVGAGRGRRPGMTGLHRGRAGPAGAVRRKDASPVSPAVDGTQPSRVMVETASIEIPPRGASRTVTWTDRAWVASAMSAATSVENRSMEAP